MECRKPNPNRTGECRQTLGICELEAAETLAGLVRTHGEDLGPVLLNPRRYEEPLVTSQDQVVHTNGRPFSGFAPINLCSTSRKLNSRGKTGRKWTEAEQEERRMRRVLANRESARQTIIRRQAMLEDLRRNAAQLTEENGNLKKAQEFAMKKHNSLKDRNAYLKAKLAKIKKTDLGDKHENSKGLLLASSNLTPRTNTSSFSSDQPCLLPPYWPPMHPFRDFSQFQYDPHSHVNPSNVLAPATSIQQAREGTTGGGGQGAALVFLPVTYLLPFVAHRSVVHPQNPLECGRTRPTHWILPDEMSHSHLLPNQGFKGETSSSVGRNAPPGSSRISHDKGKPSMGIPSATEARWRRKELMKLRNCPR